MRELTLIGLDVDGKHIICEGGEPADKFLVRVDDRLRAAVRGDRSWLGQTARDSEVKGVLRPKDIQSRIRAGAAGHDICFIHPKSNAEFPLCGEGVLIELVQAPAEVIAALA
jgi:hypothetical protein